MSTPKSKTSTAKKATPTKKAKKEKAPRLNFLVTIKETKSSCTTDITETTKPVDNETVFQSWIRAKRAIIKQLRAMKKERTAALSNAITAARTLQSPRTLNRASKPVPTPKKKPTAKAPVKIQATKKEAPAEA